MTTDDLTAKFNALSNGLLTPSCQKDIRELIFACDKTNAREFMTKLIV
ncbi:MAG: hypothetical protein ACE5D6_06110 [Candidatus Zixiibacteriota bacterium]